MLMQKPTEEMIEEWKQIYEEYHDRLRPNRKSGEEVDRYFRDKYSAQDFPSPEFKSMIEEQILQNDFIRKKLYNQEPRVRTYWLNDVLVAIDLTSGEFHVESKNFLKMQEIYDDLFAFRGLDEKDLENFFLVAQYVQLTA